MRRQLALAGMPCMPPASDSEAARRAVAPYLSVATSRDGGIG